MYSYINRSYPELSESYLDIFRRRSVFYLGWNNSQTSSWRFDDSNLLSYWHKKDYSFFGFSPQGLISIYQMWIWTQNDVLFLKASSWHLRLMRIATRTLLTGRCLQDVAYFSLVLSIFVIRDVFFFCIKLRQSWKFPQWYFIRLLKTNHPAYRLPSRLKSCSLRPTLRSTSMATLISLNETDRSNNLDSKDFRF